MIDQIDKKQDLKNHIGQIHNVTGNLTCGWCSTRLEPGLTAIKVSGGAEGGPLASSPGSSRAEACTDAKAVSRMSREKSWSDSKESDNRARTPRSKPHCQKSYTRGHIELSPRGGKKEIPYSTFI